MESQDLHLDSSNKAARVRQMFAEIAPRYDLLNHALSLNIDKRWRRFVVGKVADRLQGAGRWRSTSVVGQVICRSHSAR
jgi:hypothetical protein